MQKSFNFEILHQSKKSKARLGIIKTPHGDIQTPAFVTVGTKATVKSLSPEDLDGIGTQFVFVNTYHMVLSPTPDIVAAAGGIHTFSRISKPIITDSGGFQVFSLGRAKIPDRKANPIRDRNVPTIRDYIVNESPRLVKITDDGVQFRSHTDGKLYYFTPEFSIEAQKKIGADFIVAFDECIYYGASEKYARKSVERTHRWAIRSVEAFGKPEKQKMYGVMQGGMYQDLHGESAKFIAGLPFWGLAIGGVSVGMTKKEIRDCVRWAMDIIETDPRPRHLLGIGHIDDIVDMVKMGVDTFDCVLPTRMARVGKLYSEDLLEITKLEFKNDLDPVEKKCECYTCKNFSRAYLHHLFKQRELLAYRLATIHNLHFIEKLFQQVREAILLNEL